MTYKTTAPEL